ncbi:hypothetical protein FVE85_2932 [Porphyridium purpureum]|uniref:Uncharacterized protein n=1 Tax=Porphyridium purpureum TaxID=35688 RepID=A0A5J4YT49_PORPP|nr:hypothetical protein FVE85_2932 [Porphyridium purpureum]|eukprot:POR3409..scf227_4
MPPEVESEAAELRQLHSEEARRHDMEETISISDLASLCSHSSTDARRSKSQKPPSGHELSGSRHTLRNVSSASSLSARSVPTLQMDLSRQNTSREWLSVADKGVFSSGLSSRAERFESDMGGPCLQDRLAPNVTRTADYFALHLPLEPIDEDDGTDP